MANPGSIKDQISTIEADKQQAENNRATYQGYVDEYEHRITADREQIDQLKTQLTEAEQQAEQQTLAESEQTEEQPTE